MEGGLSTSTHLRPIECCIAVNTDYNVRAKMTKSCWESRRRSLKLWISLATLGIACPAGAELGRWTLAQPPAIEWAGPQRPAGAWFVDMPVTDVRTSPHPAIAQESRGGFVEMVVAQPSHATNGGRPLTHQTPTGQVVARPGLMQEASMTDTAGQLELSPSVPATPQHPPGPDVSAVERAIRKLRDAQLMLAEIPNQSRFVDLATNNPVANVTQSDNLSANYAVPNHRLAETAASSTSPLASMGLTELELVHSPFDSADENAGVIELIRRYADLEPSPSPVMSETTPMHWSRWDYLRFPRSRWTQILCYDLPRNRNLRRRLIK